MQRHNEYIAFTRQTILDALHLERAAVIFNLHHMWPNIEIGRKPHNLTMIRDAIAADESVR
ncbi:MAG: hypothetical protein EA379_00850 [Phycisphaerales bacterium]|nr:MAG: hypothetical protein EA379_00850 [Phycisphaerales bacterium]